MPIRTIATEHGEIEIPSTLYKYRSLSTEYREFTSRIIIDRELWWSPASNLNDEWDCNPLARLAGSRFKKDLAMRRTLRSAFPDMPKGQVKRLAAWRSGRPNLEFEEAMRELIEEGRKTIGVCSLSSNPCEHQLWSGYADGHRGICLQFDDIDVDERYGLSVMPHFGLAMRVRYQDERPEIPVYGGDAGYEKLKAYLLTKTRKWEHEAEWRLVDAGFTGNRKFPPTCLTGIIFGKDITEQDREIVAEWISVSSYPTELLQAYEINGEISIAPICGF